MYSILLAERTARASAKESVKFGDSRNKNGVGGGRSGVGECRSGGRSGVEWVSGVSGKWGRVEEVSGKVGVGVGSSGVGVLEVSRSGGEEV